MKKHIRDYFQLQKDTIYANVWEIVFVYIKYNKDDILKMINKNNKCVISNYKYSMEYLRMR